MKTALVCALLFLMSPVALGTHVDPATTAFPWMNGAARDSRYDFAAPANKNKVHVIEAYSVSCSWCNRNSYQVDALADEYAADPRVQVLDMGLDAVERDYQRWIAANQPNHPVVKDVGHLVWAALKQEEGVPQTFVLDCTGALVGATAGYWGEEERAALRAAIAAAAAVSCD